MANHSHKRDTNARLFRRGPRAVTVAAPLAFLATASVVSLGVLSADLGSSAPASISAQTAPAVTGPSDDLQAQKALDLAGEAAGRRSSLSRGSVERTSTPELSRVQELMLPQVKRAAIRDADTTRWTTDPLNLWTEPGDKARQTGELPAGEKVVLTGRSLYGRVEIVWGAKQTRWVTDGYTSEDKPVTFGGDCTNGTTVPDGVNENIKKVHAAVCAAFPDITTYGTFRGDGEHAQGIAVDIMVSGAEGYRVADFVRAHYAELGVSYVIYSQHIWSVQRSGEGFRAMPDRGSVTANHYDHVHVTTYF
ncbi:hypothetical protein BH11ACT8_BH11ACT8_31130 [soil metagenome]